jgi:hypothetical protein
VLEGCDVARLLFEDAAGVLAEEGMVLLVDAVGLGAGVDVLDCLVMFVSSGSGE